MTNAFSAFFAPIANGLGFSPDLFSSLILIILTVVISYFIGEKFEKKEMFFPVVVFMLLLWGILGYLDLFFTIPPLILGLVIYWKMGAK